MGVPLIFYDNLICKASSVAIEGEQDINYPLSNCYDYKSHTVLKYTGSGNMIEIDFYNSVTVKCIAVIHHNIFSCKGSGTPYVRVSDGANYENISITKDGMLFSLLQNVLSGNYFSISLWNLGPTMPYIGELWIGDYIEYPYPLSAPFTINTQSKINTSISDGGHFMIADYRYTLYTCRFEMEWVSETWYNTYHLPFINYALKGYPFIFVPDKNNISEFYWARLKPNTQIPKTKSYAGIIDKIVFDMEMMKYEL